MNRTDQRRRDIAFEGLVESKRDALAVVGSRRTALLEVYNGMLWLYGCMTGEAAEDVNYRVILRVQQAVSA